MAEEMIVVKQLPIIEARIREISQQVDDKIQAVNSLVVTAESKQSAKKIRAELNKEFDELETARKAVKKAILEPYENFEKVYAEQVKVKYKGADELLKAKISDIEEREKAETLQRVKDYFEELKSTVKSPAARKLITFEATGIKVNLSSSLSQLEKKCKDFVEGVEKDVITILGMSHIEELYEEYSKTYSLQEAIQTVNDRHKRMERLRLADEQKAIAEETAHEEEVLQGLELPKVIEQPVDVESDEAEQGQERLQPPTPTIDEAGESQKVYTLSFKVTATLPKLKELKEFLEKGNYIYE